MAFEAFIEAIMQERPKRFQHAMRAQDLGEQLIVVEHPWAGCPFCFAEKSTMTVYEFGVKWPCGCARSLPDLHRTPEERARCKRCCPIEESNVVPLRRSA